MDIFPPEKRSEIMSRIKGKNTKVELLLRKKLFASGLRFRINDKRMTGRPDITFFKKKVAIFVDGDWWHGRNFSKEGHKYPEFWVKKISRNMMRDKDVTEKLTAEGWKVLRYWQKDVEKNPESAVTQIINVLGKL
jgi:DNA mismatch endonuclease Vsr